MTVSPFKPLPVWFQDCLSRAADAIRLFSAAAHALHAADYLTGLEQSARAQWPEEGQGNNAPPNSIGCGYFGTTLHGAGYRRR